MKLSRFDRARETFDRLIEKYPRSGRAFDAKVGIADSYFLEGRIDAARRAYEEVATGPAAGNNMQLLQARLGRCSLASPEAPKTGPVQNFIPKKVAAIAAGATVADKAVSIQVGCFKSKANAESLLR